MNAQPKTAAWQLQKAKAKFSEVVNPKPNLYEFMQYSPLHDAEADGIFDYIERGKQFFGERDINL